MLYAYEVHLYTLIPFLHHSYSFSSFYNSVGDRCGGNIEKSPSDGLVNVVSSKALHWVPIPMPMGFGWAWVRYYCSWVGMGGHRLLLMDVVCVWVQIQRKYWTLVSSDTCF